MNTLFFKSFEYKFNSLSTNEQLEILETLETKICKLCEEKLVNHNVCAACGKKRCYMFERIYIPKYLCIHCIDCLCDIDNVKFEIHNYKENTCIMSLVNGYTIFIQHKFKKDYVDISKDKLIKLLRETKDEGLLSSLN